MCGKYWKLRCCRERAFMFYQVFPLVRHVVLASFVFVITNIFSKCWGRPTLFLSIQPRWACMYQKLGTVHLPWIYTLQHVPRWCPTLVKGRNSALGQKKNFWKWSNTVKNSWRFSVLLSFFMWSPAWKHMQTGQSRTHFSDSLRCR